MNRFTTLPALEIAKLIRKRNASPTEVLEEHLETIGRLNPSLNAFVELRSESCRNEARIAEAAIMGGQAVGPLHGVPLSIKSSIAVSGMKHEVGSRTRKDMVAGHDAPLVRRLKAAGAIVLGTTNTPEMLMAYETDNPLYGRTDNPWDLTRTPGGSSGGEAAAIASGMSAAGVGSDGGGSIRVPAHFSGICGLKPTPGRIPASGHFPESLGPFALLGVVGPMARTIGDLELLFQVMAGPDFGDTSAAPVPLRQPSALEVRSLRIGYFEEHESCPVTQEIKSAVLRAVESLRRQGFEVTPYKPEVIHLALEYWWTLFVSLGGELLLPLFDGREEETSSILQFARNKPQPTKEQLLKAWFGRDQLRLQLFREMTATPVIISPVCAVPAFRHGERQWKVEENTIDYMQAMTYTQWLNLLGNPAVVVPVSKSAEGLPIGVQIIGLPYAEEQILKVAKLVEEDVGFQRPALQET